MSIVKFSRIISCSSEDPKHPASNLLESQVGKCWKCKTAGEKQAVVILQLARNCRINSIDIGNENSAFVEIFVGRSAVPDQYEILKVASLLMSAAEAKKGENKNAVRFMKEDEFSKPAADESWDRMKITCSQPFSKLTQYGLSFIKVRTKDVMDDTPDPVPQNNSEVSSPSQHSFLGKFKFKQEPKDSDEIPSVGSLFAKRGEIKQESPSSAAAAIRAASAKPDTSLKRLSDLLPGFKDAKKKRQNGSDAPPLKADGRRSTTGRLLYQDALSDDEAESNVPLRVARNAEPKTDVGPLIFKAQSDEESESSDSPRLTRNSPLKKNQVRSDEKENRRASANTPTSSKKKSPRSKAVPNVQRKPFNRLLEDVVFVISGYQNPLRSELRSKAISMGAKYKADWDSSCTHLICAFPNTPKANAVRGKGWIMRKEWIEDGHSQRKRLLSKNYRLDKTDKSVYGNDEEIHEEIPNQPATMPKNTNRKMSNVAVVSPQTKNKHARDEDAAEENVYEVDTDVDSDEDSKHARLTRDYQAMDLEVLPEFLEDKRIYIGTDVSKKISHMLTRYVTAFKGEVVSDIDAADYVVSEDTRYKENVSNLPVLLPDWLWECTDQRRLVPIDDYLL